MIDKAGGKLSGAPMPHLQVPRLCNETMDLLPDYVRRPGYNRKLVTPGILHLGCGAFHRTHLAEYTEDLLEAGSKGCGIIAVNLRPPDLKSILEQQNHLYCRQLRFGSDEDTRLIGAIRNGITVPHGVGANQNRLLEQAFSIATRPEIAVISMTVTEKGYCHAPVTGQLDHQHLDIVYDVNHTRTPRSVPGFVTEVLRRRLDREVPFPALMSCDNVPKNGSTLRRCVLQYCELVHPELVSRIENEVVFLNTMVDRIVPATRAADLARFQQQTGLEDQALTIGEPFKMWVIEKNARANMPGWDKVGAKIVPNVHEYELIKMRVVNGMQTALCHLGHMAGHTFMSEVLADEVLLQFGRETIRREVLPNLPRVSEIRLEDYLDQTVDRLLNPALRHGTAQISTDGSQKIRHRLLDPLLEARNAGHEYDGLTIAVAAWIAHWIRLSSGKSEGVTDPISETANQYWKEAAGDTDQFVERMLQTSLIFPKAFCELPDIAHLLKSRVKSLLKLPVQRVLNDHLQKLE